MDPQIAKSPNRQIAKATIAVVVSYAVLTLVHTYPAWRLAANHQLACCNDTWLFIWTIGWDVHALTHQPWAIFDANIFYPHKNTLAYSEHLLGSVLVAAPVVWLTGNVLLATNTVAITSVFLCAIGAYILGRRLGFSYHAAFLCGLVFAFTPPRFARIYQLHLTTIQWIPFALAFLHGYFQTGRARDIRLAAAFFSLQALTSGHGAAMLTLGGGLLIAHRFATGEPLALTKRIRDVGLPGVLLLVPVALIFLPYWRARREVRLVRGLQDAALSGSSWLSSPSHADTFLVSLLPDWAWLQTPPDVHLFPGLLPLLLAAAAFAIPRRAVDAADTGKDARWWRRAASVLTGTRGLYLLMLLVTIWMALGPPFGIWPWIYRVPGLSFIRVPSRFMLLGMLALAVLVAIGFERLTTRLRPRLRLAATILLTVLLAAEFAAMPVDMRPYPIVTPGIHRWLATQPKPFSVVEVPVPRTPLKAIVARRNSIYMQHSMAHFQPLVQGYSGIEPPGYAALERKIKLFPDEASLSALAKLGVTYAAVHMDRYRGEGLIDIAATLETFERAGWLRLVHVDGDRGRVYTIHKP